MPTSSGNEATNTKNNNIKVYNDKLVIDNVNQQKRSIIKLICFVKITTPAIDLFNSKYH